MIPLGALAILAFARCLQGRMPKPESSSGIQCVICGKSSTMCTNCCKTPLCDHHLRAWKSDPSPCPCRRHG